MNISTLTGKELDDAVARALGWVNYPTDSKEHGMWWHPDPDTAPHGHEHNRVFAPNWLPSTNRNQGGQIAEKYRISIYATGDSGHWKAFVWVKALGEFAHIQYGPTPLIAAMRCFVDLNPTIKESP